MLTLDISTVFVMIVLIGILIATILAVVGKGVDSSLIYWAAGFGIHSIAFGLLALRGMIPDLYSVLLANILIASSYSFYAYGLLRFLKQRINALFVVGPVLFIAALFPFMTENLGARILVIGVVNAYQSALIFTLLLRNSARIVGRGKLILAAAFAAGGIVAMSRPVALALDLVQISSVNSPGAFQNLTFVTMQLINVAIALGLVLMQKEQAEAETANVARTDELTGLPNRRSIYEKINSCLLESNRNFTYGALLLIDLNNFKKVNDQHGHALGDELLSQAANRIRECMSDTDTAARLGGDEFVVLMNSLADNHERAKNIAVERVRQIYEALDQQYTLGQVVVIGCSGSIGLAVVAPDTTDRETLLRQADQAMYRTKQSLKSIAGRSRNKDE